MPSPNRKMSFKNKVRTQISQARLKVTSSGAYKMTAARKAALMKAVKASAEARRGKQTAANANKARSAANSGRKSMGVRSKARNAVSQAKMKARPVRARVSGAVRGAVKGAIKSARGKVTSVRANKARNDANSGRKSMGVKSKAKNVVSQANMKSKPVRARVKGAVKGATKYAKGKATTLRANKARSDANSGRKSMSLRNKAKTVVSQANMKAKPALKTVGKAAISAKNTTSKKVSKLLGTDGKNGPQNGRGGRRGSQGGKTMGQTTITGPSTRAKVSGLPTKPSKSGPAARPKGSSTARAITSESKKLQARGAKPATAKRTAQQKVKLQKKKK
jgi:hypothetical protein